MSKLRSLLFCLKSGEKLIPRLKEFLMREQAEIEAGKRKRDDAVIHDAKLAVECFRTRQDEYNHDDPTTKDYFHPSAIGQCLRKLWFRQMGAPCNGLATGTDLLRSHLTFEIGTYAHVMFQNLCERAGLLEKREFPVRDDVNRIIGHADGILQIEKERPLLEIKTINARGFAKLTEPKPEHVMQATIYEGLLKLGSALFIYFEKDSALLKEYNVPFSQSRFQSLLGRIKDFRQAVKTRTMPNREGSNPNLFPCSYCEFSAVCFSTTDQNAFLRKIKANVPRSLSAIKVKVKA